MRRAKAKRPTGRRTKRAVVEEDLRLVVRIRKQTRALKMLKGLGWEGDLEEMRRDRPSRLRDPGAAALPRPAKSVEGRTSLDALCGEKG
jgi:hypothetical protein